MLTLGSIPMYEEYSNNFSVDLKSRNWYWYTIASNFLVFIFGGTVSAESFFIQNRSTISDWFPYYLVKMKDV